MYDVVLCDFMYDVLFCIFFFIYLLFLKSLTRDKVCKLAVARSPIYVASVCTLIKCNNAYVLSLSNKLINK